MDSRSTLDEKLMEHLCELTCLKLSSDEKDRYLKQLQEVLAAFAVIQEADVSEDPSFHSVTVENVWREDKVKKTRWDPLGNSKSTERGYFKGPSIV